MKYKTTKKQLKKEGPNTILGFGYCQIQDITRYLDANAYILSGYGWACDVYDFEGWSFTTGYDYLEYFYKKEYERIGELMKKDIIKLNDDIKNGLIKLPSDWSKAKKEVAKKLQNIFNKHIKKIY